MKHPDEELDKIPCSRCGELFDEGSMEIYGFGENQRAYCNECEDKNSREDALNINRKDGYLGSIAEAKRYVKTSTTFLMAIEMIEYFNIIEPRDGRDRVTEYSPGDYLILWKHIKKDGSVKYNTHGMNREAFKDNWREA